jgi:transposase
MKFFAALPPCLIGMEACATAHYWARGLKRLGHQVRLMPASHLAELGMVAAQGRKGLKQLLVIIADKRMTNCRLMRVRAWSCLRRRLRAADADRINRETDHCATSCE